jgi:8-oxo-dGTP diphosphatase
MSLPTPIAIAVVEYEGQFLVGQRPDGVPLAGYWEFPGGKIEPNETPEAAAVRECFEEAGIDVEVTNTYPEHVQHYRHDSVQLCFIACRPVNPKTAPREPFRWVRREELSTLKFPAGNRALVRQLLETT